MSTSSRLRLLRPASFAVLLGSFLQGALAGDGPALDAERAAKIATVYLAQFGPNAPHIVSLTLEKSGLVKGRTSWIARWSRTIDVEGDRELGLRVNLDGTTVRLVEDKSSASRPRGNNINR
jgi:hypothetical protein